VELGFIEDDPAARAAASALKRARNSPPIAELAMAWRDAGRGETIKSPSMISPITFSGRRRMSS
jgi:hypothetical protein